MAIFQIVAFATACTLSTGLENYFVKPKFSQTSKLQIFIFLKFFGAFYAVVIAFNFIF